MIEENNRLNINEPNSYNITEKILNISPKFKN